MRMRNKLALDKCMRVAVDEVVLSFDFDRRKSKYARWQRDVTIGFAFLWIQ